MSAATSSTPASAPPAAARAGAGLRRLGRFEMHRLLGKSSRTMLWLAHDPALGADVHLTLPRQQPADAAALDAWLHNARRAAKLVHPQLLATVDVAVEDRWPFIACDAKAGLPLEQHLAANERPTPPQAAQWLSELLHGLAYLHDAGLTHGDIGLHSIVIDAQGRAQLMAASAHPQPEQASSADATGAADALHLHRAACTRDLLACGLVLHWLLAGNPALDEADVPTAIDRLDREIVRLGWTTPQPVPESLRAIVNRGTEREPLRRYLSARTLQRALQGWLDAQAAGSDGALALLLDRLQTRGHLPALPGLLHRVTALAAMEKQSLDQLTEVILQDPAFAFELLRQVNAAQFAAHADGGVSSIRRAVQLVGVQGLKRTATGLREWPGALDASGADALAASLRDAQLAAHVARILCPADMDGEEAFVVTLLQHLGQLLARYHFPDEAMQIDALVAPLQDGPRGMDPTAAACAVLGIELEALAVAVARYWGLDEPVLQAMRAVPLSVPVRAPDDRQGIVRLLASAASEAVTASKLRDQRPPTVPNAVSAAAAGIAKVTQRYMRALVLAPGELTAALQQASTAMRPSRGHAVATTATDPMASASRAAPQAPAAELPTPPTASEPPAPPKPLRAALAGRSV